MNRKSPTKLLMFLGAILAISLIASYVFVYIFSPFSEFWNAFVLALITALSALTSAMAAFLTWRLYERDEMLYTVWRNFAIGLSLWVLAELAWMYLSLTYGLVPDFSLADVFWMSAYIFFSLALLKQYHVVFQKHNSGRMFFIVTWLLVISATSITILGVGNLTAQEFFSAFALYFYPYADLAIAIFAIVLVHTFRGGTLARPWLSVIVFVVSDSFYIWAVELGLYDWMGRGGDYIRLVVDGIYIIAYLALAWGIFSQYTLLKFGPGNFSGNKEITTPLTR